MKKGLRILALLAAALLVLFLPKSISEASAAGEVWTVTYHTNGGTPMDPVQVKDGEKAPQGSPTRDGYKFAGWYVDPELTEYYGGGEVKSDLDLYAKWDIAITKLDIVIEAPAAGKTPAFTDVSLSSDLCSVMGDVVYNHLTANGGIDEPMGADETFEAGKKYFVLIWLTPESGYQFSRREYDVTINGRKADWWTAIGNGMNTVSFYVYMGVPDKTVPATLSFDLNGGTSGAPAPITTYLYGDVVVPKSCPVREGYYFRGWSESSRWNATVNYKGGDVVHDVPEQKTLYAIWERRNFKLSFDINGGTGTAPATITAPYYSWITVPKSSLKRENWYFMGWSTTKNGEAEFKSGDGLYLTQNTVLYAVWKPSAAVKCRLSFDRNGGSGNAPAAITVSYGATATIPKSSVTREGHYFMGWSVTRGGEVAYKSGDKLVLKSDTVLYAVWKKQTVSLTFDSNGGSGNAPAKVTTTYGSTVTIAKSSVTRTGYWFLGWATERNATAAKYKSGDTLTLKESTKLYAVWKKK